MYSFKLIYFVNFLLILCSSRCEISHKRLCVDKDCKEPISLAKTLLRYSSPDPKVLSFKSNENIKIFSKEASSKKDSSSTILWETEINGKRGYIPSKYVREIKIISKPTFLVDTESKQTVDPLKEINPDKVKNSFHIVDGTTILKDFTESISQSSIESSVLSTIVPSENKEYSKTSEVAKDLDTFSSVSEDDVVDSEDDEDGLEDDDGDDDDDDDDDDGDDDDGEGEEAEGDKRAQKQNEIPSTENQSGGDGQLTPDIPQLSVEKSFDKELFTKTDEQTLETSTEMSVDVEVPKPIQDVGITENPYQAINSVNDITKKTDSSASDVLPTNVGDTDKSISQNPKEKQQQDDKKDSVDEPISEEGKSHETNSTDNITTEDSTKDSRNLNSESKIIQETNLSSTVITAEKILRDDVEDLTKENQNRKLESKILQKNNSTDTDNISVNDIGKELTKENLTLKLETKISDSPESSSPSLQYGQENIPNSNMSDIHPKEKNENSDSKHEQFIENFPGVTANLETMSNDKKFDSSTSTEKKISHEDAVSDNIQDTTPEETILNNNYFLYPPDKLRNEEKKYRKEDANENNTMTDSNSQDSSKHAQDFVFEEFPEKNIASVSLSHDEKNLKENFESLSGIDINLDSSEENRTEEDTEKSHHPTANDIELEPSDSSTEINEISSDNVAEMLAEGYSYTATESNIDNNEDKFFSEQSTNEGNIVQENKDSYSETFLIEEQKGEQILDRKEVVDESQGVVANLLSLIKGSEEIGKKSEPVSSPASLGEQLSLDSLESNPSRESDHIDTGYCDVENCDKIADSSFVDNITLSFNYDVFLYLVTTAVSCIIFLFMYLAMDNSKRMTPLISKINKLEKELLVIMKENDILKERELFHSSNNVNSTPTDEYNLLAERLAKLEQVKQVLEMQVIDLQKELDGKEALEEQIESLEKELETSTEVGMELNRIIAEMLDATNGSEKLQENVEQLQRQLMEQKNIIASVNKTLKTKESQNAELLEESKISQRKILELQKDLDERVEQILKIEKEKEQQQNSLQDELLAYQQKYNENVVKSEILNNEIQVLRNQLSDAQRQAELRVKEYHLLKESLGKLKSIKNNENVMDLLLESTSKKAEYEQLKMENERFIAQLKQEEAAKIAYENKYEIIKEENNSLLIKYQEADKEKVEINMKLEVLTNYFKKKEEELQGEILKYKSIWNAKEGEATSTSERIRLLQEEIENYKSQNETLKQEIISQEIELKSQISILEKKVHENWVSARQMERKLEDARQESAQLRNRLTLRERAMVEERAQNRLQSPLNQNGELPLSPHPIESAASPQLLFGGRDHITKSPPLPALPPHFLPPPPGAPFMPPPLPGMPFLPPPPTMFPVDHRPPPLGRMSSPPPLNSRYSPDTSAFSPYDRNSPSPPYDSEYGASPPPMRRYSPYERDERRDYKRPPHVMSNGRNLRGMYFFLFNFNVDVRLCHDLEK
nr:transport and Golgi organization protein 1-like [Leptinotarsa decemlineata]